MARTIHCTMLEVPAMNGPLGDNPSSFEELLPWADPYIAALIAKLRASDEFALQFGGEIVDELPPPLLGDEANQDAWQADWSVRNWPRQ